MKFAPIITHATDLDFYKVTMLQVMFHKHPNLIGVYIFECRNKDVKFSHAMVEEINEQINHLCTITFTERELNYLKTIRFLKPDFIEALRFYKFLRDYVEVSLDDNNRLSVKITGPMWMATLFEIYLLEIINEVYFRMAYDYQKLWDSALIKTSHKIEKFIHGDYTFKFSEFGCRRRLSKEWHAYVLKQMLATGHCIGTSNIYLAMEYNIMPVGTYAHEYVQMFQGIENIPVAYSNYYATREWTEEYQGDNGTALTDTLTTKLFLKELDFITASCFSTFRFDSGNDFENCDALIARLKELGIDPMTKTALFSNSLNFDKAQEIEDYFKGRIKTAFGIGTFVTNDTCVEPLNIVIKLQYVNGHPVAKLSDNPEKAMCQDPEYLEYLRSAVERRLKE